MAIPNGLPPVLDLELRRLQLHEHYLRTIKNTYNSYFDWSLTSIITLGVFSSLMIPRLYPDRVTPINQTLNYGISLLGCIITIGSAILFDKLVLQLQNPSQHAIVLGTPNSIKNAGIRTKALEEIPTKKVYSIAWGVLGGIGIIMAGTLQHLSTRYRVILGGVLSLSFFLSGYLAQPKRLFNELGEIEENIKKLNEDVNQIDNKDQISINLKLPD
jgi:hypothetical protein